MWASTAWKGCILHTILFPFMGESIGTVTYRRHIASRKVILWTREKMKGSELCSKA